MEDEKTRELRELLRVFVDAAKLPGHVITRDQWERACLHTGRWCPPYIETVQKEGEADRSFDDR